LKRKLMALIILLMIFIFFVSLSFTGIEGKLWEYNSCFYPDTKMNYGYYGGRVYFTINETVYPIDVNWNDYNYYGRGFSIITVTTEQLRGVILSIFYGKWGFAFEIGLLKRKPFFDFHTIHLLCVIEFVPIGISA